MLAIRTCPERRCSNGLNSGRVSPSPIRECSIAPAPLTRGMQSPMLSSLMRLQPALLTAPGGAPASPEPGRSPTQDADAGRQAAQDKALVSRLSFAGKLYMILQLLPSRVDGRQPEEFLSITVASLAMCKDLVLALPCPLYTELGPCRLPFAAERQRESGGDFGRKRMKKSTEATLEKVYDRFRFPSPLSLPTFRVHAYAGRSRPQTSAAWPLVPLVALRDMYFIEH